MNDPHILHLSEADHPLSFRLGGRRYNVAARGEVAIPATVAFAVKSRGLPLAVVAGAAPSDGPLAGEGPDPDNAKPADPLAALWWTRAHETREALLDLRGELEQTRAAARASEDEGRAFAVRLRDALGIGSEDSILAAVEGLRASGGAGDELAAVRAELAAAKGELARANGRIGALTAAAGKASKGAPPAEG